MNASALIFTLEGLFSSGTAGSGVFGRATGTDALPRQRVAVWLQLMKTLLRSKGLRDATDWDILYDSDVVSAASSLDASGGTVYGVLVDSIFDVAGENALLTLSNITATLDASAVDAGALQHGTTPEGLIAINVPVAAGTDTPVYETYINPSGVSFGAGIFACAEGVEATDLTANDMRIWVVYRTDTETQID